MSAFKKIARVLSVVALLTVSFAATSKEIDGSMICIDAVALLIKPESGKQLDLECLKSDATASTYLTELCEGDPEIAKTPLRILAYLKYKAEYEAAFAEAQANPNNPVLRVKVQLALARFQADGSKDFVSERLSYLRAYETYSCAQPL